MIIFNLDNTLSNCEHRRHFVESGIPHPTKEEAQEFMDNGCKWKPDWQAYNDSCEQDTPIQPVVHLIQSLWVREGQEVEIWTGRTEEVRSETEKWINKYLFSWQQGDIPKIKMRPIGDTTSDCQLKSKWLEETYEETKWGRTTNVDFVFDSDPDSIKMFRSRGIFVFDCNQGKDNENLHT